MTTFSEIIDAASALSADEQQALVEIISRRLADQNRARILRDVAASRAEFAEGGAARVAPHNIVAEITGET